MQTFTATLLALSATLSLTSAIPSRRVQARTGTVAVTLFGATNDPADQYSVNVPIGGYVNTDPYDPNDLSISRVDYDHDHYTCKFIGIDQYKSPASAVVEANGGQLGPPQTIIQVGCSENSYYKQAKRTYDIEITLKGATDDPADQYTLYVAPGATTPTAPYDPKGLSISKAVYDHEKYTCSFVGVDSYTAPASAPVEANVSGDVGQVGPPQTITYVTCNNY